VIVQDVSSAEAPVKRRRKVPWGVILAGVAIAAAVIYLVVANTGASAEFYMTISELHSCKTCGSQAVRVAGVVQAGSVTRNATTQVLHFEVADSTSKMPVVYSGVVPDVFRPGIQVVVEGHLVNGVFQADNMYAKCPSKFQTATPAPGS